MKFLATNVARSRYEWTCVNLGDQLKEKLGEGVVVLASDVNGKVNLMATATDGAMDKGAHAGNLIKASRSC